MKKTHNTDLPRPTWSPTCFGNVAARDFAFRFVQEAATIAPPSFHVNDLDSNCQIIAWAGLLAAIGGDQKLIDEIGFAIEFVREVSNQDSVDAACLEQMLAYLKMISRQSAIKDHWSRELRGIELDQLLRHLIAQLERFPGCKKTKFHEMSKKEMKAALRKLYHDESAGDCLYDETLMVEDLNPLDILDLGRYRRIRELRVLAKTSLPASNSMDWNIKFALQN